MAEPTITCPKCAAEIKLTESLAAPLIESTRRDFEQRLAQKDMDFAKKEQTLLDRELALTKAQESVDAQVAEKLKGERAKIESDSAKKAKMALGLELDNKAKEVIELQDILKKRDEKLAEAQKAQADLIRKQRELDDAKREMDLTIESRIQERLEVIRGLARKEAEDQLNLKVMEKEKTINEMQKKIEELKRKSEQGSQQLQGEVQELMLEAVLAEKFPEDEIEPISKGVHGGDVLHRVVGPQRQPCGTILWESKRTKNWSDGWLSKLREDQRIAKADVAIIVTQVLPKGIDTFDLLDGVWITHPRTLAPVALALRQMLVEVGCARQASEGQQTKTELVYQYLTGPGFRQRVQAIAEAFSSMGEDLRKERAAIMKQWAKREKQIECVMQATVGMYGDLQGIAGKTLKEIEGLNLNALELNGEDAEGPVING